MENTAVLDWVAGGAAILLVLGGLGMMFSGLISANKFKK